MTNEDKKCIFCGKPADSKNTANTVDINNEEINSCKKCDKKLKNIINSAVEKQKDKNKTTKLKVV